MSGALRAAGSSPSVMFVHGAGGGAWEWNVWHAVLQAHAFPVQSIDLRPGSAGLPSTSLQDYAQQLRSALQSLPHPRVVIGASLGGLLSVLCADAADALVLVNPLPPSPWHHALQRRAWDDVIGWQRDARLASTRTAMADANDTDALFAYRHWRNESGRVMREAQAGIEMPKPACPALFVISKQDEDVPPHIILAWAEAWQARTLETLASSHVGPLLGREASRAAAETVAWINQLALSR